MATGRLDPPLGVWLVGARGAVATTTVVGAVALRRGLIAPVGMTTAHEPFAGLPMCPVEALVFGGHDPRDTPIARVASDLAAQSGILDRSLVESVTDCLEDLEARLRPAPVAPATGTPARELVRAVQRDLAEFAATTGVRRTVVVNVASTEAPPPAHPAHHELSALEQALDTLPAGDAALPPSLLYAYAALDAGHPYVNFTPSTGAAIPALEQLSRARGVPHAGRDGKTGETLLKTVLAPMFAMRRLTVTSWAGVNLLGNGDGRTLSDPEARRSKVTSKARAVPEILGYDPHSVVHIDYVPSCGDRKIAWDLIQFEGFLGSPMSLQFMWQASDSALAAPLVLDLVRLTDLASERGESGALGHLAFFFKAPLGSQEHDLSRQHALLREHLGC